MPSELTPEEKALQRQADLQQKLERESHKQVYNDYIKQTRDATKFSNALQVTPTISASDLLVTKKTEASTAQPTSKLFDKLLKIADNENAVSMLEAFERLLNPDELDTLNEIFAGIVTKARKQFSSGIKKDSFIAFAIDLLKEYINKTISVADEVEADKHEQKNKVLEIFLRFEFPSIPFKVSPRTR